jgi:hypothetical protein
MLLLQGVQAMLAQLTAAVSINSPDGGSTAAVIPCWYLLQRMGPASFLIGQEHAAAVATATKHKVVLDNTPSCSCRYLPSTLLAGGQCWAAASITAFAGCNRHVREYKLFILSYLCDCFCCRAGTPQQQQLLLLQSAVTNNPAYMCCLFSSRYCSCLQATHWFGSQHGQVSSTSCIAVISPHTSLHIPTTLQPSHFNPSWLCGGRQHQLLQASLGAGITHLPRQLSSSISSVIVATSLQH